MAQLMRSGSLGLVHGTPMVEGEWAPVSCLPASTHVPRFSSAHRHMHNKPSTMVKSGGVGVLTYFSGTSLGPTSLLFSISSAASFCLLFLNILSGVLESSTDSFLVKVAPVEGMNTHTHIHEIYRHMHTHIHEQLFSEITYKIYNLFCKEDPSSDKCQVATEH